MAREKTTNDSERIAAYLKIGMAPGRRRGPSPWAAPNNYRSDRVSGDPPVIPRSPCDEAIQGPQHAWRQQPRRSSCGPWIASLRSQ
jgi:hypothetical protein